MDERRRRASRDRLRRRREERLRAGCITSRCGSTTRPRSCAPPTSCASTTSSSRRARRKHNNSQAFYLYSYEPGGNRIEIYTSGFFVNAPDFEPVVWNEETRGPGVYWGAALPDSFLNYATPVIEADDGAVKSDTPVIDAL